jgi:hypothetical protein
MALLPGSPAINAGTSVGAPTTDQRGMGRVGAVDIGAFESHGFTVTPVANSTPQSTAVGTAFANPIAVTVKANNPAEPVNGGVINFAALPASNGASAILSARSAVITGGAASIKATANTIVGSYTVTASAAGVLTAGKFVLTNQSAIGASTVMRSPAGDTTIPADHGAKLQAGSLSPGVFIGSISSPSYNPLIYFDLQRFGFVALWELNLIDPRRT